MEEVVQKPEHLPGFEPMNPRIECRAAKVPRYVEDRYVLYEKLLHYSRLDWTECDPVPRCACACLVSLSPRPVRSTASLARGTTLYPRLAVVRLSTIPLPFLYLFSGGLEASAQLQSLCSGRESIIGKEGGSVSNAMFPKPYQAISIASDSLSEVE